MRTLVPKIWLRCLFSSPVQLKEEHHSVIVYNLSSSSLSRFTYLWEYAVFWKVAGTLARVAKWWGDSIHNCSSREKLSSSTFLPPFNTLVIPEVIVHQRRYLYSAIFHYHAEEVLGKSREQCCMDDI